MGTVMRALSKRLHDLEAARVNVARWHRIITGVGQGLESARAEYEAVHGPIAEGEGIIHRMIVTPQEYG